jgi:hypothetical protein
MQFAKIRFDTEIIFCNEMRRKWIFFLRQVFDERLFKVEMKGKNGIIALHCPLIENLGHQKYQFHLSIKKSPSAEILKSNIIPT